MIGIPITIPQDAQKHFKEKIKNQWFNAIKRLEVLENKTTVPEDLDFVKDIIKLFKNNEDILTALPETLVKLTNTLIVPFDTITKPNGTTEQVKRKIKDDVISALGYKGYRKSFYPAYFASFGIKACIYCNSQLTVSVGKLGSSFSAHFDVDHYFSKDDFPWLSICLFNLYPACASCNRRKSTSTLSFDLYTLEPAKLNKSDYSFGLDAFSKTRYMVTKNPEDIRILFREPDYDEGINTFEDTFQIRGIYTTQLDIVEELIAKSQIYDESYRALLKSNFAKLGLSDAIYKRIILGNYNDEREIHKRPMSKFMQDIAKEIGLLE